MPCRHHKYSSYLRFHISFGGTKNHFQCRKTLFTLVLNFIPLKQKRFGDKKWLWWVILLTISGLVVSVFVFGSQECSNLCPSPFLNNQNLNLFNIFGPLVNAGVTDMIVFLLILPCEQNGELRRSIEEDPDINHLLYFPFWFSHLSIRHCCCRPAVRRVFRWIQIS